MGASDDRARPPTQELPPPVSRDFRRVVPALADTALASLATFTVSLIAIRYLEPADLGAYAVAFQAFLIAAVVPTQLLFVPAEVAVLDVGRAHRLAALSNTLRAGAPAAAVAATAAGALAAVSIALTGETAVLGLAASMATAATLSPLQDHVRRMLHQAGQSWRAALVSLVQFVAAVAGVISLLAADVSALVVPFTALTVANAVSLLLGLALARGVASPGQPSPLARRLLMRSGRWLLALGLAELGCTFLAVVTVAAVGGQPQAGYAEAARVLSQPIYVLAMALTAVMGPEITLAARTGNGERGRLLTRVFTVCLAVTAVAYVLAVGTEWPGTPLTSLFPNAYHLNGLLAVTVVSQAVNLVSLAQRAELMGHGKEARMAVAGASPGVAQVAVATSALAVGAFALPLGTIAAGVLKALSFQRILRSARRGKGKGM